MSIPLTKLLKWMGTLDDSPGEDTARERFRNHLKEDVKEVSQIRGYITECLENSGIQYSRALQDLINHLGYFLEFEVIYGRYQGVQGQTGFDGYWISAAEDLHIVVEVKTSEVHTISIFKLVGYVDRLISSEKKIPSWENALGLFVVGRRDPDIRQIENSIVAEKRTHQLRSIFVESLLRLAEIKNQHSLTHKDVLSIMRPSGPGIDSMVVVMEQLVCNKLKAEDWEQLEALPPGIIPDKVVPDIEPENNNLPEQPHSTDCPQREKLTSAKDYYFPILKALNDVGGAAKKKDLQERVEQLMKGKLKEVDYQSQPYKGRENNLRWHNRFSAAGEQMVKDGFLRNDSLVGFWEITDAGCQFLVQRTADVS